MQKYEWKELMTDLNVINKIALYFEFCYSLNYPTLDTVTRKACLHSGIYWR